MTDPTSTGDDLLDRADAALLSSRPKTEALVRDLAAEVRALRAMVDCVNDEITEAVKRGDAAVPLDDLAGIVGWPVPRPNYLDRPPTSTPAPKFTGKARTSPSTLHMDGTSPVVVAVRATTDELRALHNQQVEIRLTGTPDTGDDT
jgi:hypothetical protein